MPVELPELEIRSKSPNVTPEMIAEVFEANGFTPPSIEEITAQPTPDEIAAAEEATETAAAEAETARVAAEEAAADTERKSRNQKRREAREKLETDLRTANERATKYEKDLEELRAANASTLAQVEDLRKNPPKAEPEPEAPKKPSRADFLDAEDPEEAFDDAKYEWRRKMETFEREKAERGKPKVDPQPVVAAQPETASTTDDSLKAIKLEEVKDMSLRRFLKSAQTITDKHPGAYKALVDNIPNICPAMSVEINKFDEPARIALYLAQHPDESKRIKALTDGNIQEDPKKLRTAQKELEKIEQLAAEEDAAPAGKGGSGTEEPTEDEVDPDDDSVATQATQPQTKPAAAAPQATPAQKPQQKKHTPIEPVGARGGNHAEKTYDEMSAVEQKALWNSPGGPEKIRKMKNNL